MILVRRGRLSLLLLKRVLGWIRFAAGSKGLRHSGRNARTDPVMAKRVPVYAPIELLAPLHRRTRGQIGPSAGGSVDWTAIGTFSGEMPTLRPLSDPSHVRVRNSAGYVATSVLRSSAVNFCSAPAVAA